MQGVIYKISFLLLLLPMLAQAQTGYRKVHPDGTVEFSDQPIPGGEEIKLREAPTIQFVPPTRSSTPGAGKAGAASQKRDGGGKSSITIASPREGDTLWFNESGITVSVTVTPALQGDQQVRITLDGSVVATGKGSSINIGSVNRGSHSLGASVLSNGAEVARSTPVNFFVRQHSVIDRNPAAPTGGSTAPQPILPN